MRKPEDIMIEPGDVIRHLTGRIANLERDLAVAQVTIQALIIEAEAEAAAEQRGD